MKLIIDRNKQSTHENNSAGGIKAAYQILQRRVRGWRCYVIIVLRMYGKV